MARNLKYQWCGTDKSHKEFLGWIYDRLQGFGDRMMEDHMRRLDGYIDDLPGTIPDGPPITIDITDNKPVTILRHGKLIYKE